MWINRLRTVLRLNAATSLAAGLLAAITASWVSETLGIDNGLITRLVGIGLVLFAADVAFVSTRAEQSLVSGALLVSVADASWVVASLVVVALGLLTTIGTVVALVVALGVADFAVAQMWMRSRIRGEAHLAPGLAG